MLFQTIIDIINSIVFTDLEPIAVPELKPTAVPELEKPEAKYLSKCTTLHKTAMTLVKLYDYDDGGYSYIQMDVDDDEDNDEESDKNISDHRNEVFNKVFDFVSRQMVPSFDEINDMLLIARILLKNNEMTHYSEFILNCPDKFLMTYANNSERTPFILRRLEEGGYHGLKKYLLQYVHDSKLKTWNERYSTHKRGALLIQSTM